MISPLSPLMGWHFLIASCTSAGMVGGMDKYTKSEKRVEIQVTHDAISRAARSAMSRLSIPIPFNDFVY